MATDTPTLFSVPNATNDSNTLLLTDNRTITLANLATVIFILYSILICSIGIPGNILAIVILKRQNVRNNFIATYLVWLAALNIICIFLGMSRLIYNRILATTNLGFHDDFCLFHTFLTNTAITACNWHLVLITASRWLYLHCPARSSPLFTSCNMCLSVVMLLSGSAAVQVSLFYTERQIFTSPSLVVLNECETNLGLIPAYVTQFVIFASPMAFLVLFSSLIFWEVKKRSRGRMFRVSSPNHNRKIALRDKNLCFLLVVTNVQFLISNLPAAVVYFTYKFYRSGGTTLNEQLFDLTIIVARMLLYGGYATNCIIYCCFGVRFRNELTRLLLEIGFFSKRQGMQASFSATAKGVWTSLVEPSFKKGSAATVYQTTIDNEKNDD